ncbi:MAG: glycosyltransferase [Fluviicola sp.]|nr:glycosyltransferase [Fluviicola sp.]
MKIALLSVFYPYRGGIAQFSAMLYRALENEHELKAFTFSRQYPNFLFPGSSQFVTENDKVDEIPAERTLDSVNPMSFRKTASKINAFAPDLFISQYWMTFFGPATGGVQKRLTKGMKRISILHNVIPHEKRFFDNFANRSFIKHNEGFIVLSDSVLQDLLTIAPDAKYLRIDHPVYNHFGEKLEKETAIKKLHLSPNKKQLLFFGFIREYKGLDILLRSLENLPEEFELIIAGEIYGSFDVYQSIIDAAGLKNRVHLFNEYIPDDEVATYFSAADVCILPYKGATQSGITAIAHHFDLPIVATNVGGLKETIAHEETGLIIQPDSKELSDAIKHIYSEDRLEKFSENIKNYKAKNSWSNFAKKVIEFSSKL